MRAMTGVVQRSFRYRFYPTAEQAEQLRRTFGCVRLVYNKALQARTDAWRTDRRRIGYGQTSALLTEWKRDPELAFLGEVSCVPLQQTLRHLDAAFAAFFAKRAHYPRFKSRKRSRAAAEYTRSAFRWRDGQLWLAKMSEPLNIVWSRPLPPNDTAIGVDVGLTALVTLSTGEKVANPRHERADRRKLAKAQRALCRKQKGSANRAAGLVERKNACGGQVRPQPPRRGRHGPAKQEPPRRPWESPLFRAVENAK